MDNNSSVELVDNYSKKIQRVLKKKMTLTDMVEKLAIEVKQNREETQAVRRETETLAQRIEILEKAAR